MLKYMLTLSIVAFCHSMPRGHELTELVFIQRSPVSAVYAFQNELRNKYEDLNELTFDTVRNFIERTEQSAAKWLTHGWKAYDADYNIMENCTDLYGQPRKYESMVLEEDFREDLKSYWPSTSAGLSHEQNWAEVYDRSGSCIASTPRQYFQFSKALVHIHHMGRILSYTGIAVGSRNSLQELTHSLQQFLRFRPYLKCLPNNKNLEEQYLFEVQLCFNNKYQFINCVHNLPDDCDESKVIVYPDWPTDE